MSSLNTLVVSMFRTILFYRILQFTFLKFFPIHLLSLLLLCFLFCFPLRICLTTQFNYPTCLITEIIIDSEEPCFLRCRLNNKCDCFDRFPRHAILNTCLNKLDVSPKHVFLPTNPWRHHSMCHTLLCDINISLSTPRFAAVDSHGSFLVLSIHSVFHVMYSSYVGMKRISTLARFIILLIPSIVIQFVPHTNSHWVRVWNLHYIDFIQGSSVSPHNR